MKERFFVMLHSQRGDRVLPLVEENGEVCMFDSTSDAVEAANENDFAVAFGFDVFQMFCGIDGQGAL